MFVGGKSIHGVVVHDGVLGLGVVKTTVDDFENCVISGKPTNNRIRIGNQSIPVHQGYIGNARKIVRACKKTKLF